MAAFRGHTEVVNLLLEKGANIEAKNKFGYTALHLAAYFGELEVATALIEKEENKKEVNQNQKTPLHLAAQEGHAAIVNLLLEKGANIEAEDKYGKTPLHLATFRGHTEVVSALKEAKAAETELIAKDPNLKRYEKEKSRYSPLMCAINNILLSNSKRDKSEKSLSSGGVEIRIKHVTMNTQTHTHY